MESAVTMELKTFFPPSPSVNKLKINMYIIKRNGTKQDFDSSKINNSLLKIAGDNDKLKTFDLTNIIINRIHCSYCTTLLIDSLIEDVLSDFNEDEMLKRFDEFKKTKTHLTKPI